MEKQRPEETEEPGLVGLVWKYGHFFAYGDYDMRAVRPQDIDLRLEIAVAPIGEPRVVGPIPFNTPYSRQVAYFREKAPPDSNAFALGDAAPGRSNRNYFVAVQYYRISERELERAMRLEKREWEFGGFF